MQAKQDRQDRSIQNRYVYVDAKPWTGALETPLAEELRWTVCAAQRCEESRQALEIVTDDSAASYQVMSQAIEIPPGGAPVIHVRGSIQEGAICLGLLNEARDAWLGSHTLQRGPVAERLCFAPNGARKATLVLANAGLETVSQIRLDTVQLVFELAAQNGHKPRTGVGMLRDPQLASFTERHKIDIGLPALYPVEDPCREMHRQAAQGLVVDLGRGCPQRFHFKLAAHVLSQQAEVWFYWPAEQAIEKIDQEKLYSYWRHWWIIQAYHACTAGFAVCRGAWKTLRAAVADPQRAWHTAADLAQYLYSRDVTGLSSRASSGFDRTAVAEDGTAQRTNTRLAEIRQLIESAAPVPFQLAMQARAGQPLSGTGIYLRTDFWAKIESGGSYGHTCYVAKELAALSDNFVAFLPHPYRLLDDLAVRQVSLDPPSPYGVEEEIVAATGHYYPRLKHALQALGASYIYERICLGNYTGVKLSQDLGLPYIVEYNGSEISMRRSFDGKGYVYEEVYLEAERAAFAQATLISVVSEPVRDDLVRRGVDADKILVNPNGVDPDVYAPLSAERKQQLRHSLGFADAACVIGFTGTFGGWHGIDVLAEALPQICQRCPQAQFLLIGDGNYKHLIDAQVDKYQLSHRVHRMGRVPQQEGARLLGACDLYVSPHSSHMLDSRFFGSPTKIFEYMAMGQGIVASDLEQIGQVLSPALRVGDLRAAPLSVTDQRAVLCTPGDVGEFVEAVVSLVQAPAVRTALGHNARQAVLNDYAWQQHVANLWHFLRNEETSYERTLRASHKAVRPVPEGSPGPQVQVQTGDSYKDEVQNQWDKDPCGSHYVKEAEQHSLEWFREAEAYRYGEYAPWMRETMEFAQHAGEDVLEIGAGMGTDLSQFAQHGARVTDFDLSTGHLRLAQENFHLRGLSAMFVQGDAEILPFKDNQFDLVYSNGVIHHTPNSRQVVADIYRILKPGGKVITMLYAENSLHYWWKLVSDLGLRASMLEHCSMGEIMSRHVELSPNGAKPLVKVYTKTRLKKLFEQFSNIEICQRQLVPAELPSFLRNQTTVELAGKLVGWNLIVKGIKPEA